MQTLGYYNGELGELEDMKIPMLDRVSYFGDGVYDATYSRNYNIYGLAEHIDRLYRSAEALEIAIPMTKSEMADILQDMVRKMDTGENFVYWQVTKIIPSPHRMPPHSSPGNLVCKTGKIPAIPASSPAGSTCCCRILSRALCRKQ